ncbi:MAG: rRNA maturation RNase YbeY [Hyphomicrobiaceae bacterium]
MALEVVVEGGDWPDLGELDRLVAGVARAVAQAPAVAPRLAAPAAACVAFATDADVRALNARYRAKDKPTNVLSFPAQALPEGALAPGEAQPLGDVVLAAETVAAEAKDQGIPLLHHIQHLVVHGVLHLLGNDHESDAEAEVMEALETNILAALGVPDPYRSE